MPDTENADVGTGNPNSNTNRESVKTSSHKLSSSPQLDVHPMQSNYPVTSGRPSSSSGRHSHSRSKSVNLSPTIGAAGPSFTPNAIRWDGYPAELPVPSSSSAHALAHLGPAARVGSPLLRPSSPLHVNVQSASPSTSDFWRFSPGSESGSSEGSSPDIRRLSGSHFAKVMERSASSGSVGSNSSNHLSSPRSSFRRTASPSRAYAVPLSPRLQALGGSSMHVRKLSGGSASHLHNLGDSLLRAPSPLAVEADPELPIDSVWPANNEHTMSNASPGAEAIPIGASKSQSTPIPPSLRDELSPNNLNAAGFTTIYPSPSSPNLRSLSVSPQDEYYLYRNHRTPSPSGSSSSQKRRSSGSPAPQSPTSKIRPHSSPSSLPTLAAPKAISRRGFNLDSGQPYSPQAHHTTRRHARTTSSSSSGSNRSDTGSGEVVYTSPARDDSPTQKALSPVEGAYAKLDAQHALAEVTLGPSVTSSKIETEARGATVKGGDERGTRDGEQGDITNKSDEQNPLDFSISPSSSSMMSLTSTKALASTHGISMGGGHSPSLQSSLRGADIVRASSLPTLNGHVVIGADGNIFRSKSPAISSPRMETVPLGESPPKTRSFIGMPPRSGYDLSDDPDDVGSDNGSTGSGRESINEDRDNEDSDSVEGQEDESEASTRYEDDHEGQQRARSDSLDRLTRPVPVLRRPSLTLMSSAAASIPPSSSAQEQGEQFTSWKKPELVAKRADLALTRDEGMEDEDDDDDDDEEQDEDGLNGKRKEEEGETGQEITLEEETVVEESLSTLERIFLFAKSEMTYHRVLVSHSLADWILEVELSDAVEFVIPLLNGLACDENEVCTAFAPHLHRVMWHFFRNCPLVEDTRQEAEVSESNGQASSAEQQDKDDETERATRPKISVGVFTPLLCALLLNYNAAIASATQSSIVRFFARLQGSDFLDSEEEENNKLPEEEQVQPQPQQFSSGKAQYKAPFDMDMALIRDAAAREQKRVLLEEYHFDQEPRQRIMEELLYYVGLAIGNLNVEQTNQVREMASQPGKSPEIGSREEEEEEEEGGDAIMDDISLNPNHPATGELEEGNLHFNGNNPENGDTEMSMDFLDEGAAEEGRAAIGTSVDNESMTMSDVEEEVAVGRMASISLLAALGAEDLLSRDFLIDRIVPEMTRFASDHTFFVRKEVAVAMGALARCIGYEVLKEKDLLSTFERFCKDRIWHVRQAACLSLPNLFAQVSEGQVKREKVVEIMRIFVDDVSLNVRVAALDIIGEMIYLFYEDPNGVPPELVRHFLGESFDLKPEVAVGEGQDISVLESSPTSSGFESLMQGDQDNTASSSFAGSWGGLPRSISTANASGPSGWSSENERSSFTPFQNGDLMDPDRPLVMAYNFPAVMLTLGKSHWPKLKAIHSKLCNSISPKARRSLAASLHEVAKIIGVEWSTEDLLRLMKNFLDSQIEKDEQVKMAMLQNLDIFMEHLTLATSLETLKFLLHLWNEESYGDPNRFSSNWRLREKLISLIPSLAKRYLLEDDEGVLVVLMQSAIVDSVSSVRLQGIKIVGSLYHIFEEHDQVLADGFLGMLVDVGENESYRGRVACINCLTELCKSQLQRSSVEMLMMSRLVELSKDDVVDVRVALAQLVSLLCSLDEFYALPNSRSEDFINLLRRLSHDKAELVREVTLSALRENDSGREEPLSWPTPRMPRQLILGPSDGNLHRPSVSERSFDMNGDSTGEVQSFDMDEEEESFGQQDQSVSPLSSLTSKTGSPLLQNSMLMKRRFLHRSQHPSSVQLDPDSSMFEDADDDDDDDHNEDEDIEGEQQQHLRSNGYGMTSDDSTIVIPSQDNFLMLSTDRHFNSVGNDTEEGEELHHLLKTASDSPMRSNSLVDASKLASSSHNLSLESPERPWNRSGNQELTTSMSQSSLTKSQDPFLAFVANKQYDQDDNEEDQVDPTLSSPAGGSQKTLSDA